MSDAAISSPLIDDKPCFATNPEIFKLGHGRAHILAHDIGQGSTCRNTSTCRCEGLDLHFWRKMCKNCGCRMDEHDVVLPNEYDHAQIVIGRLFGAREHFEKVLPKPGMIRPSSDGIVNNNNNIHSPKKTFTAKPSAVYNIQMNNGTKNDKIQYAWAPCPDENLVSRYMKCLPEEERPIVGSKGEQSRKSRLQFQLPLYDCNVEDARFVEQKDVKTLRAFVDNVRANVIGVGEIVEMGVNDARSTKEASDDMESIMSNALHGLKIGEAKCRECTSSLHKGDIGVECVHQSKTNSDSIDTYHPNCFRCETCRQLLVDNIYFFYKDKYYCGRHYADQLYPRCAGCDELIFANEYTFAEEKSWHFDHFACYKCDFKLGGSRYMTRDENPYCLDCYLTHFAKTCGTCQQKIGPDEKRLNYNENYWHAEEKCFQCIQCKQNLIGKKFMLKSNRLLCSSQCKAKYNSEHPNDQL